MMLSSLRRPQVIPRSPQSIAFRALHGTHRLAAGRATHALNSELMYAPTPAGKWLKNSGEWLLGKTVRITKHSIDRHRVNVTNQELVDDAIKHIGSSLDRHIGCDILDINPGVGVWSHALQHRLKPRSHVLMEPDVDFYEPQLAPLLAKPGVRVVKRHGVLFDQLEQTLAEFPHQTLQGDSGLMKRNDTLLVTMNLASYPKRRFNTHDSLSALIMHQIFSSVRSSGMYQRYGLVRSLVWVCEDDKRVFLPKTVYLRRRGALDAEVVLEWMHQVVGVDDDSEASRQDAILQRQPIRSKQARFYIGRQVVEKMKRDGRMPRPERQTELIRDVEEYTLEAEAKEERLVDEIIEKLKDRRAQVKAYEEAIANIDPLIDETDPSNFFSVSDIAALRRNMFFFNLPDNETGETPKKPQPFGVTIPPRLNRPSLTKMTNHKALDEFEAAAIQLGVLGGNETAKRTRRSKKATENEDDGDEVSGEEEPLSKDELDIMAAIEAEITAEVDATLDGRLRRRPRKKKTDLEAEETPKKRSRSKKAVTAEDMEVEEEVPKKRRSQKKAEPEVEEEKEAEGEIEEEAPKKRKSRKKVEVEPELEKVEEEVEVEEAPKKSRRKVAARKNEEIEDIEDIEELEETITEDPEIPEEELLDEEPSENHDDEIPEQIATRAAGPKPPPSVPSVVRNLMPSAERGARSDRYMLSLVYMKQFKDLRSRFASGKISKEEFLTEHNVYMNELRQCHINFTTTTRLNMDEDHCMRQDPPVLLWDRREYESLVWKRGDNFPNVPISLLDIQPKDPHPNLRPNSVYPKAGVVFDMLTMSAMNSSLTIFKSLNKVWGGAGDGLLPHMQKSLDINTHGTPAEVTGTDITTITGRRMNEEQYLELLEAWFKWPFRPSFSQLISHHVEDPVDADTAVSELTKHADQP